MALTRHFKQTVVALSQRRATPFGHLDEAATLLLNGEPAPARTILRAS